jgi:AAA15 family ATPase/GTPase
MIKEISISDFYSFNHKVVRLDSHTNVFIGINGAGKSNFLKQLGF